MSIGRRERSSDDLARARAIARQLRGEVPTDAPVAEAPVAWVRFAGAKPEAPAALPVRTQAPPSASGLEGWNRLLDWCLETAGASGILVMDAQGLVIAHRGVLPFDDVEGMGAHLILALEHANELQGVRGDAGGAGDAGEGGDAGAAGAGDGPAPCAIALQLGGSWLVGARVWCEPRRFLTIGIVGPHAVAADLRRRVEEAVLGVLGR